MLLCAGAGLGVSVLMARCLRVVPMGSRLLLRQTQILQSPSARECSWTDAVPQVSRCSSASLNEGFCFSQGAAAHGITVGQKASYVAAGLWKGKAANSIPLPSHVVSP